MGDVIKFDRRDGMWRLFQDGHPVAVSVRREVLERRHPEATTIEEGHNGR